MIVVAVMKVKRAELEAFRAFETVAARRMAAHGGRIERTVVSDDGTAETLTEIHFVRFESPQAFAAYRADPELSAHAELRARSVVETTIYTGEEGPAYG